MDAVKDVEAFLAQRLTMLLASIVGNMIVAVHAASAHSSSFDSSDDFLFVNQPG